LLKYVEPSLFLWQALLLKIVLPSDKKAYDLFAYLFLISLALSTFQLTFATRILKKLLIKTKVNAALRIDGDFYSCAI